MNEGRPRTLREKWRLTSLSNKTISVATVVIALSSVMQFATALLQWNEMSNSGKQTEKIVNADDRLAGANERFATAMEASLGQAQKSLSAIVLTARLDQRAWLSFEDVYGSARVGSPGVISAVVKNTGKTPAINVLIQYFVKNIKSGDKIEFTYRGIQSEPSRGLLPPNADFHIVMNPTLGPLVAEEMNRIRSGEKRVYFYGRATYDDIFSRHHWVTFCSFLSPDGGAMVYCSEYNGTDRQEDIQP